MVEVEEVVLSAPTNRRKQFEWLWTTFIRPRKAMHEIACEERSVWLIPMLILTVLTLVSALVAGPLRKQAALNAPFEPPESFQWMTPEQQEQYMQAQQSGADPVRTHVFPAIGALASLWFNWFLLGSVLHLVLTMLGSRGTNTTIYNLTAWASLPFAVRIIVQIIAMLTNKQLLAAPGISGFVTTDGANVMAFIRIMLSMVDIYLIWQIILLWIGASSTSGLTPGKAFSGVLISVVLLLAIASIPGFLMLQFGGLSVTRPFFFY